MFEFDQSIIVCEEKELIFIVADSENKTCHGNVTLIKDFDCGEPMM